MTHSPLLIQRGGGVAHLRFNQPVVLSALDVDLAHALLEACRTFVVGAALPASRGLLSEATGC